MPVSEIQNSKLNVFESSDALVKALAERIVDLSKECIEERGEFTLSLSGGSTPKSLYALLSQDPYKSAIDWTKVKLFLGDERCVPHDNDESNFKMVTDQLLSKISIPSNSVFPTEKQDSDPQQAAADYEKTLRKEFKLSSGVPRFDLTLLGLGPDGHTASLFPESEALKEHERLFVANFVKKFDSWRLTMTYPVINASRHIFFLVAGDSKADIIHQVLQEPERNFPSQKVSPEPGALEFYLDKGAAKLVKA